MFKFLQLYLYSSKKRAIVMLSLLGVFIIILSQTTFEFASDYIKQGYFVEWGRGIPLSISGRDAVIIIIALGSISAFLATLFFILLIKSILVWKKSNNHNGPIVLICPECGKIYKNINFSPRTCIKCKKELEDGKDFLNRHPEWE